MLFRSQATSEPEPVPEPTIQGPPEPWVISEGTPVPDSYAEPEPDRGLEPVAEPDPEHVPEPVTGLEPNPEPALETPEFLEPPPFDQSRFAWATAEPEAVQPDSSAVGPLETPDLPEIGRAHV